MQRGSLLPLIAGLLALSLAAMLAISAVTSLTLERHRLVALAEATALRAAESFAPKNLSRSGAGVVTPLTNSAVRGAAVESLRHQVHSHRDLRLLRADTTDGVRARIVLQSMWQSPIWSEFLPLDIPVTAEAYSRSIVD